MGQKFNPAGYIESIMVHHLNEEHLLAYWDCNDNETYDNLANSSSNYYGEIYGCFLHDDVPVVSSSSILEDIDYQSFADSLVFAWAGSDEASGIAQYRIFPHCNTGK